MSKRSTLPESWLPLLDKAGSVGELVAELGLKAPSSLWRIASLKTCPSGPVLTLLHMFCKRHKLSMPEVKTQNP